MLADQRDKGAALSDLHDEFIGAPRHDSELLNELVTYGDNQAPAI